MCVHRLLQMKWPQLLLVRGGWDMKGRRRVGREKEEGRGGRGCGTWCEDHNAPVGAVVRIPEEIAAI